ncbi:zincin-like metallopeptidase domain-containing protein [Aestuariibacter sp. A3R04]|uniref:zincin-like metallopeptidase domain-containing protein n=1 Tax=Aestuariibacter sp. A3R04 TaxID=2841571 RepID=UPI001C08254A|nr:zincin-like metallopeptidase domain-containing protein [Aestuariibacter sp. A3R04]MBU3021709.1 DUF1738 domain-containing protein [Aestuariibacter sp. A3R04]
MLTLSQFRNSYPVQLEYSLATGSSPQTLLKMSAKYNGSDQFHHFLAQTATCSRPIHFLGHDRSLDASVSNLSNISKQIANIEDSLGLSYQAILEKIACAHSDTLVSKVFDLQAPGQWQDVTRDEMLRLLGELHYWVMYINDLDIVKKDVVSAKSLYYFLRRHPVAGCQTLADVVELNHESWDLDEHQYYQILHAMIERDSDCILRWIEQPEPMAHFNVRSKVPYHSMWSWLILSLISRTYGYTSNLWGTKLQWKKCGFKLRKNAMPAPVFHYFSMPSQELSLGEGDEGRSQMGRKVQLVYNASCLVDYRGLPYEEGFVTPLSALRDRIEQLRVDIREGDKAHWVADDDYIEMPPETGLYAKNFTDAYYQALLPEFVRWAGHKSRVNAGAHLTSPVQQDAFVTLVSEVATAHLSVRFGLDRKPCQTSVQRIGNWIDDLDIDSRFRFVAEASECANRVCNFLFPDERQS